MRGFSLIEIIIYCSISSSILILMFTLSQNSFDILAKSNTDSSLSLSHIFIDQIIESDLSQNMAVSLVNISSTTDITNAHIINEKGIASQLTTVTYIISDHDFTTVQNTY